MEIYRRVAWGRFTTVEAAPLPEVVEAGGVRLEVVETPGHSPDHVCFFERERGWLFTGDLFLAERQRYLRMDEDLATLIDVAAARVRAAHGARLLRAPRAGRGRPGGPAAPARPPLVRCASACSTCWGRASPRPRSRGGRWDRKGR